MIFCSESVSEGHPDKICDQISDAILDECLAFDKNSRVSCEVLVCKSKIIVAGEITTKTKVNYEKIVQDVLAKIDYSQDDNINLDNLNIEIAITTQSPEISETVNKTIEHKNSIGAGDQGQMFGYACDYFQKFSNDYMPLPHIVAHSLIKKATDLRKSYEFVGALPDMKSQVVIEFHRNHYDRPIIKEMIMSIQHKKNYDLDKFNQFVHEKIMIPIAKQYHLNIDFKFVINPSKSFHVGAWIADTGLTGRKIIVDTYGGWAKHGGGCFSGKDPSKVDRTGAYFARYIAKNLVAAQLCNECAVQISYIIGSAYPITINVNTMGTGIIGDNILTAIVKREFNWSLSKIIKHLKLREISYYPLSKYGHFGKHVKNYPWEQLDRVDDLLKYRFTPLKNKEDNL